MFRLKACVPAVAAFALAVFFGSTAWAQTNETGVAPQFDATIIDLHWSEVGDAPIAQDRQDGPRYYVNGFGAQSGYEFARVNASHSEMVGWGSAMDTVAGQCAAAISATGVWARSFVHQSPNNKKGLVELVSQTAGAFARAEVNNPPGYAHSVAWSRFTCTDPAQTVLAQSNVVCNTVSETVATISFQVGGVTVTVPLNVNSAEPPAEFMQVTPGAYLTSDTCSTTITHQTYGFIRVLADGTPWNEGYASARCSGGLRSTSFLKEGECAK